MRRWVLFALLVPVLTLVGLNAGLQARPLVADGAFKLVTLTGKVTTLTEALAARKITSDKDPIARQVVLVDEHGTITPILSDDASRAFFLDPRVRDRKTELIARKYEGLPYLQVVSFKIEEGGSLRTPEYYCEICSISVRYPQDCPCCQGQLIFRMKPED
jgi:hypothetical protein